MLKDIRVGIDRESISHLYTVRVHQPDLCVLTRIFPEISCVLCSSIKLYICKNQTLLYPMSAESVASGDCRPLATVVVVRKVLPVPGADMICLAEINGWQCVIKKDEFAEGDLAIYYSIDSVPDFSDPNFDVVKRRGGRIKTIRLRGVLSQGMLSPLSWLQSRGHDPTGLREGDDVTEKMGVTKYISEEEMDQYFPDGIGKAIDENRLPFPSEVPKTDETRLQDRPQFLGYLADRNIVITRKEDGCSATFMWKQGVFSICGRNFSYLAPTPTCRYYYLIANKLRMEEAMRGVGRDLAIQGEIVGPKINGNRMRLEEYHFKVFNVFDISTHKFLLWREVRALCESLGLSTVPVIFHGNSSSLDLTVPAFLGMPDDQTYTAGALAEGIVVKTDDEGPRLSFKVISNRYILKYKL